MARYPLSSLIIAFLSLAKLGFSAAVDFSRCRCFPGDACWPGVGDWANLNRSIEGGLIATVPIGSPCHNPTFDAAQCKSIQENWTQPSLQ